MSIFDDFIASAQAAESGGNPNAHNPTSSASGLFGFTDPTWEGVVKKYGPQYGLTIAGKNDPAQQQEAMKLVTENEYAPFLASHGIANPTKGDLYSVHFWGAGNLGKLLSAGSNATLKDALGDSFDAVFKANKKVFGNNPNVSVGDAMNDVSGLAGSTSGALLPTRSVGPAPIPPSAFTDIDPSLLQKAMKMPDDTSGPDLSALLSQAQPQQPGMFSPVNLLRLAAGLASGNSFGQGLSAAFGNVAQGMNQDREYANQQLTQRLALARLQQAGQELQNNTMTSRAGVAKTAGDMLANGVPPNVVFGLLGGAGGSGGAGPNLSALQTMGNTPLVGNRKDRGDLFYDKDGNAYQQTISQVGGKTQFTNLSSGQTLDTLPQGSMRAQDMAFKTMNGDNAQAQIQAQKEAQSAVPNIAAYQSLEGLIPQIAAGGDVGATLSRNLANLTGGDQAAAQQMAGTLMQQLAANRIELAREGGKVSPALAKAVAEAGPNWQTNPTALKALADYGIAKEQRKMDMLDAWNQAPDDKRRDGFRNFSIGWNKENPYPQLTIAGPAAAQPAPDANTAPPGGWPMPPGMSAPAPAAPGIRTGKSTTGVTWSVQ